MAENTVEILIRARDEATRVLNQATAQVQQAAAGAAQASTRAAVGADRLAQSSISASQKISAMSAVTRFASFGLVQELSPALGTTVTRMASLSTVAVTTGNVLSGVLLAGGITAVIAGLGLLIKHVKDTIDAENAYAEAIEKGTLGPIAKRIEALTKMREAMDRARPSPADIAAAIGGVAPPPAGFEEEALAAERATAISVLRIQGEIVEGGKQVREFINEQNRKRFEEDKKLRERIAEGREASAKHFAEAQRLAVEAEGVITEAQGASLEALHQQLLERWDALDKDLQDRIRKYEDLKSKVISEGQRLAVEAEGVITDTQAAQISALQQDFEERTLEGLRRSQQPIVNAMTTLGHASADALFDALTGRARTLGETIKSLFDGLARDIFRNTLSQLFGGQQQGLSLQNLLSLGGGGGPLGRTAAVAAGVPGLPGTGADLARFVPPVFAGGPAISFAGTTVPTADILREAGLGGIGASQALGGALGIFGGALGLLAAFQSGSAGLGAISGALGGLSLGLGAAQLGLGAASTLGPIGLVAGAVLGGLLGAVGRRRARRRQAELERQIRTVNIFTEWLNRNLPTLTPRQILQLIAYLRDGTEPTDERLIRIISSVSLVPRGVSLPPTVGISARPRADLRFGSDLRSHIIQHGGPALLQEMIEMLWDALFEFDIERILENIEDLEAFAPGISLFEVEIPPQAGAAPPIARAPRDPGVIAARRGLLGGITRNATDVEIEELTNRIRSVSELAGIPILPQARFVQVLG